MALNQASKADEPAAAAERRGDAWSEALASMDSRLGRAGGEASGFGGLFVDSNDNTIVYVYMLDTTQKAEAERAATSVLGPDRVINEVRVLQGQYSMDQLQTWYNHAPEVMALQGVVTSDLHEGKNRLYFGVESPEALSIVEVKLPELGIPREAVIIELVPPVERLEQGPLFLVQ